MKNTKEMVEDKDSKIQDELIERIKLIESGEEFAIKMRRRDYIIVAIIILVCLIIVIGGGIVG